MLNRMLRAHESHRVHHSQYSGWQFSFYPSGSDMLRTGRHLAMYENLKSLSVCDESDVQQQTLGPKGVQSAQQCGSVGW
jgi:hypothetical protein